MNRRKFTQDLISGLSSFALFESVMYKDFWSPKVWPIIRHWAVELEAYCQDLRKGSISQEEWRNQIADLYQKVELSELLTFIEFSSLTKSFEFPDLGVATSYVKFPRLEGLPARSAYVKKIFGMKKGRAIIPHGHANMLSSHLLLKGEMHLRNFDKIGEEKNHLIIRPSKDHLIQAGQMSSISDEKDNIHWFTATTDEAFTFDVILLDLDEKPYDIYNLDMHEQEKLPDGQLKVPILDVQAALKKYGKESHH